MAEHDTTTRQMANKANENLGDETPIPDGIGGRIMHEAAQAHGCGAGMVKGLLCFTDTLGELEGRDRKVAALCVWKYLNGEAGRGR